jgi:hypothetical protein
MLRIQSATPLEGTNVNLLLTDGTAVERDLAPLMSGRIFQDLLDNTKLFRQMSVVDGAIVWPNGLDLCPDMTIWGGAPPVEEEDRLAS